MQKLITKYYTCVTCEYKSMILVPIGTVFYLIHFDMSSNMDLLMRQDERGSL